MIKTRRLILCIALIALVAVAISQRADASGKVAPILGHPYYANQYSCLTIGNNESITYNGCSGTAYWEMSLPVNSSGSSKNVTVYVYATAPLEPVYCTAGACTPDNSSCNTSGSGHSSTTGVTSISLTITIPTNGHLDVECSMAYSGAAIYDYVWDGI